MNFSSKYYTLPADYQRDIYEVWNEIILEAPLKYKTSYSFKITKDNETSIPGVPQIYNGVISLPEYFIDYVWEFYYPNYHKAILACTILHELAHAESGIPDKPPYEHHRCDIYAVNNLLFNGSQSRFSYSINDFYSSLLVVSQYWDARKGVGGHLCNIGWNALNVFSIAMGSGGCVGNLYATDISTRLSLFKSGNPSVKFVFKRTNFITKESAIKPEVIFSLKKENMATAFSASPALCKPALLVKDGKLELPKKALLIEK